MAASNMTCACGARLQIAAHLAGKRVKCPKCGAIASVPSSFGVTGSSSDKSDAQIEALLGDDFFKLTEKERLAAVAQDQDQALGGMAGRDAGADARKPSEAKPDECTPSDPAVLQEPPPRDHADQVPIPNSESQAGTPKRGSGRLWLALPAGIAVVALVGAYLASGRPAQPKTPESPGIKFRKSATAMAALDALRKLRSYVGSGVAYNDYGKLCSETSFSVDKFTADERELFRSSPTSIHIVAALTHFQNANSVWAYEFREPTGEPLFGFNDPGGATRFVRLYPEMRKSSFEGGALVSSTPRLRVQEGNVVENGAYDAYSTRSAVRIIWGHAVLEVDEAERALDAPG